MHAFFFSNFIKNPQGTIWIRRRKVHRGVNPPSGSGEGRNKQSTLELIFPNAITNTLRRAAEGNFSLSSVLEEMKKLKDEMQKHNKSMVDNFNKLADNYRKLSNAITELSEQSFQIETSSFKANLIICYHVVISCVYLHRMICL